MLHSRPLIMAAMVSIVTLFVCVSGSVAQISSFHGSDRRSEKSPDTVLGSNASNSFRINNKVYLEKEEKPVSQSCTMFYDGKVYDFMTNPEETIIYDPEQQRFLLLCAATQSQCMLSLDEVLEFGRMMKESIPQVKDEFLRNCLDPKFEISVDEKTEQQIFEQAKIIYKVSTQRELTKGMAKAYADFANNYAILNVLLSPQNIPPFARIKINETIAEKDELPETVEVIMKRRFNPLSTSLGKQRVRTVHNFMSGLGDADMKKIRKSGEYFGQYKQISFSEYQDKIKQLSEEENGKNKKK